MNTNTRRTTTMQTDMTIPAALLCGREAGKTIAVSAGVHSRHRLASKPERP